MNLSVTEDGVLIPKQWLQDVDEVEVLRENHLIVIIPQNTPKSTVQLNKQVLNDSVVTKENAEAETQSPSKSHPLRVLGMDADKEFWISEDFDAPLPQEIQRYFE
jgi:virulence-associated protein VagC